MNNTSKTDWARIDAMADGDIDTSDIPPLPDEFFAKAQLRMPQSPVKVAVSVDTDTLAWFQSQGESADQQMSIALRIYAEAHKAHLVSVSKVNPLQQANHTNTADG
ncbi:MAG: hypothetical protein IGQ88_11870 [Gloeomargaritaceae cyanobacterium C42_A2020_066]|nr:hypothetical protein [Gloeomargaritaceae cyanobacterium C42_A2020_066]